MKRNAVLLWSWVVALGGFLFGFDTAVISGAEVAIQKYWHLSAFEHGLTVSIALIGTVIGAMLGSRPSDRFGRKNTLYFVAAAYLLSSLGTALTDNWHIFLIFRFLGGLGVGTSSVTAPIYISEVSPAEKRGRLVGLFQFNVVLGILVAYTSNYVIALFGTGSWRWMLGVQAVPAFIFLLLIRLIPESPRWLVLKKGEDSRALEILRIINPLNCEQELQAIKQSGLHGSQQSGKLFSGEYKKPVVLAILIAFFQPGIGHQCHHLLCATYFNYGRTGSQSGPAVYNGYRHHQLFVYFTRHYNYRQSRPQNLNADWLRRAYCLTCVNCLYL